MSDPDVDAFDAADKDTGAACAAALEELFRQYPPVPYKHFQLDVVMSWREEALKQAARGRADVAILVWATNTGVPDDVLNALHGLLRR